MMRYIASILLFFSACADESYKVEQKVGFIADSLFRTEKDLIHREMDSLCQVNKVKRHDFVLDSIIEVRKEEILKLQRGL
jgi:high-affinity K+ transport system ATPase subunit B